MITENDIRFYAATDVGCVRTNNEDTYICDYIWDKRHILVAAIDGMGGYEGGEVAAQIARDTIVQYLQEHPNGERLQLLKESVCHANNEIFRQRTGKLSEMGCVTTTILIELDQMRINMAHVGDTRLYQCQYSTGAFHKLSHDHSLVGYREEIGDLTEEEAMHHSMRSVINRDLGGKFHNVEDEEFIESQQFAILPNSVLMLCSDGLCDMIMSYQMQEVLVNRQQSVTDKVQTLIEQAKLAGGKDNITVAVVEILGEEPVPPIENLPITTPQLDPPNNSPQQTPVSESTSESKKGILGRRIIEICLLLIVGAAIFAGGYYCGRRSVQNQCEQDTTAISLEPANTTDSIPPTDTTAIDSASSIGINQ